MRAAWMIVALGCGAPPAAGPTNIRSIPDAPPPRSPVVENCEASSTGFAPGFHDRYSFEDPKTTRWGFKNKAGTIVIPAIYEHVYEFSPHGMAGVVIDKIIAGSPFLFIDPAGKVLARPFAYDNGPDYFQEGYARIIDDHKRIGYIDERGTIAIPPRFDAAAAFCHGKAEVEIDGATYFIDRQGNKTAPPKPEDDPHAGA